MSFATSLSRTKRPTLRMHAPRNVSAAAELKHACAVPSRITAPMNSSTAARTNQGQTLVRSAVFTTTKITRSGLVSIIVRLLLNLIWLLFGGLVIAAGLRAHRAGHADPHHHDPVRHRLGADRAVLPVAVRPDDRAPADAGAGSLIGNVIWFVLAGWWLAIGHLVTGVLMCLTIIGIPLGLANFKLIPVSLTPFGREIVDIDQAQRLGIQTTVAMPVDPSR